MPKPAAKQGPLEVGDEVEAIFPDDGLRYPAVVEQVDAEGMVEVRWDDPDGGPESSAVAAEDVRHAERCLRPGDEVDAFVQGVRNGKLELSLLPPEDVSSFDEVSPDLWLDGQVEAVLKSGIHVSVAHPAAGAVREGFVHISQIKDGYVRSCGDEVAVGDQVKVRVLGTSEEYGTLKLSMRRAASRARGRA